MSDARRGGCLPGEAPPAFVHHLAEMARFVAVGLSAVATDFAVYFSLTSALEQAPVAALKGLSFVAGAAVAFVLNRGFVFRARGAASAQIPPFVALYGGSLLLNMGVNGALLALGASRGLAWFLATGASTVSNYLGMKFIVFRRGRE